MELMDLVSELGVSEHIRILGHIPKLDQVALIKSAEAVIQPTLFEGGPGGGAAFDAISLGTPVIASDISVNLEMDCGEVSFFSAGNQDGLCRAMLSQKSGRYYSTEEELWKAGISRSIKGGKIIRDIVEKAINESKQSN